MPVEEWQYHIHEIKISGNEKTKKEVILRELTFSKGSKMTIPELEKGLAESRINLVNTGLFINHGIKLSWERINRSEVGVLISVQERWYLWPEPILQNAERNFNSWLRGHDFGKLSYGINLIRENFRGRDERLTFLIQNGYNQKIAMTWSSPALQQGMGNLGFSAGLGLLRNRQVATFEEDNRLIFTHGDKVLLVHRFGFAQLNLRPSIHHFHTFRLTYHQFRIDSSLVPSNPLFTPGNRLNFASLDFDWMLKIDHRDHKAYPLKGYYADFRFTQHGVYHSIPEDWSYASVETSLRKFFVLHPRVFFAAGFTGHFTNRHDLPFLFREGLGYGRNFVRGYEYNTIHGSRWMVMKETLKFTLLPEKSIRLPFMPHPKFRNGAMALYLNLFADVGYVHASPAMATLLSNRWLTSGGLGLDLVTYYDKVLRIEFTLNDQREAGVFVHFVAPI